MTTLSLSNAAATTPKPVRSPFWRVVSALWGPLGARTIDFSVDEQRMRAELVGLPAHLKRDLGIA